MEENDGNMVRFRLVFVDRHLLCKSQRSQGLRRCWYLLKPDITNIGDLASHIQESFGLRNSIALFMDDFVLPSFESTGIITDKDIIWVKKKEAKQNGNYNLIADQNLLQDFENDVVQHLTSNNDPFSDGKSLENSPANGSCDKEILTSYMENLVHSDPHSGGDASSTKRKKKRSKKLLDLEEQHEEINSENVVVPTSNSDGKKEKHHCSDGDEDVTPSVVRPRYNHTQSQEPDTQLSVETQPLHVEMGSVIMEEDMSNENLFPQTTDNDLCFKDGVHVSDGILPVPKPEVFSSKQFIRFESLHPLRRLPVKGDILAYRYVKPSSSAHIELSSPQVGKVSSFDCNTIQIILVPVLDYGILEENPNKSTAQPNTSPFKEDGSLEIEYLSLVDVRLLKAHDSEEVCNSDQSRINNWEEALAKGGWNCPNSSIAEQNNGWGQWNSNKSTLGMPQPFKQPNSPFAGRGVGRTNWVPNRYTNITSSRFNPNWNNAPNLNAAIFHNANGSPAAPPWFSSPVYGRGRGWGRGRLPMQ